MMMMMFDRWKPQKRIEYNYKMALFDMIERFNKIYSLSKVTDPYELLSFFREYCSNEFFMQWAYAAASMMITGLKVEGAKTWRQAATKSMNGKKIYWMLQNEMQGAVGVKVQNLIDRNALLISSFPESVARETAAYINSQYQTGRRAEFIAEDLKGRFPKMAKSRLELISRTEVSKASTALTRARSEEIGSGWFVWRTSKDARVRQSHRDMDRVLVNWNDLPSPETLAGEKHTYGNYAPGDIFNCRCYPQPVIDLNLIKFPSKIYYNGSISMITRAKFEKLNKAYSMAA